MKWQKAENRTDKKKQNEERLIRFTEKETDFFHYFNSLVLCKAEYGATCETKSKTINQQKQGKYNHLGVYDQFQRSLTL